MTGQTVIRQTVGKEVHVASGTGRWQVLAILVLCAIVLTRVGAHGGLTTAPFTPYVVLAWIAIGGVLVATRPMLAHVDGPVDAGSQAQ